MSGNADPPEVFVIEWNGERIEYHRAKKPKFREKIEATKTLNGKFQEEVMDLAGFMIPESYAAANKTYFQPMHRLNRLNWFVYREAKHGAVSNKEFDKAYKAMADEDKVGPVAMRAMVNLIEDTKAKCKEGQLSTSNLISMEKVAGNLAPQKNYCLEAIRQLASERATSNGSS